MLYSCVQLSELQMFACYNSAYYSYYALCFQFVMAVFLLSIKCSDMKHRANELF